MQVYNTLTRQKDTFTPITPGKVSMYVCGVTVYDLCHIGHARVMVVFDLVYRHLMDLGYDVTYIRNITDIDDKIIKRANENGEDWQGLTERFIDAMHEDERALGVLEPTQEPKATDNIQAIIDMVQKLIDKGFAYAADNGDVYYRVERFEGYGKLSGKNLDELRAGERVAVEDAKETPFDFVLWKKAKAGEPAWASPWGDGRPGWHIECSAMSTTCLSPHFDIHGGGRDLQFPHHENEIAQSEAAHDCQYANYWVHNGFVTVEGEKMSKSLGNFTTIRDALEEFRPEVIRYFILTSHYRSPLDYAKDSLNNAEQALVRLYTALRDAPEGGSVNAELKQKFSDNLNDDFNSSGALAVMMEIAKELNKAKEDGDASAADLAATLKACAKVMGLLDADPTEFVQGDAGDVDVAEIERLIKARLDARANKDWGEADRVRDTLTEMGIVLEDKPEGTIWRKL